MDWDGRFPIVTGIRPPPWKGGAPARAALTAGPDSLEALPPVKAEQTDRAGGDQQVEQAQRPAHG